MMDQLLVKDNTLPSNIFSKDELYESIKYIAEKNASPRGAKPLAKLLNDKSAIEDIFNKCGNSDYRFAPYDLKLQLKGRGKPPREMAIPSFQDQAVLKSIDIAMRRIIPISSQTRLASAVVKDIKLAMRELPKETRIRKIDIKKYFDSIDREILFEKLQKKKCPPELLKLIQSGVCNPLKDSATKTKFTNDRGVPQGVSISSYLSDIYLENFEEKLDGCSIKAFRYVDDIIVFYHPKQMEKLNEFISSESDALGIEIHGLESGENKYYDESLHYQNGFDYLGYRFIQNDNTTLVSIREFSVTKFVSSVISIIRKYDRGAYESDFNLSPEQALHLFEYDLNEKITGAYKDKKRYGWLWYFRQINNLELLDRIDRIIDRELRKNNHKRKIRIKRLKRTYYEIKKFHTRPSSYILDYGLKDPVRIRKIYGEIYKPINDARTEKAVVDAFNAFTNKRLKKLELDEGIHS